MKKLFFSILFLLSGLSLVAQTTVTGTVKEADTGTPMQGVNIVVEGKTLGTVSDYEGNFVLQVLQEPPFRISLSMVGFEPEFADITRNGQSVVIQMNETRTELDEVIISASRTPERIMESPVTIKRMDVRDIQQSTSADFYGGLQNIQGVDVNTNSLTFKSVNTRGFATFANTRFVQLVDGMDNSSPALNFALGNLLGMSELDVHTIELLPGASSALYGANAFNGIMFMESKNPFDYPGVSFYGKTGMTMQDQSAGANKENNSYVDAGFRAAHVFSEKFAAKVSVSFLNGMEWYATDYRDFNNPELTRSDPAYDGLNIYGDEVSTTLDLQQIFLGYVQATGIIPMQQAQALAPLLGDPVTVSRTGYKEVDMLDYGAESVKADVSLNFRPNADDLEIILNGKYGTGNTIYQGANRYSIQDFYMYQLKMEIRNDNFFVRAYTIGEDAKNSYDTRFAAINLNRSWKSDTQWFTEYATAYIGGFAGTLLGGGSPEASQLHQAARAAAQTGVLVPGSAGFISALETIKKDPDLTTGSRFVDNTQLHHVDANYNFRDIIDFADVQVGGSWRQYSLNSQGSIFTDYDGPINYNEIGAYTQVQKVFAEEHLKFTGSVRFDKAKNFDGFLSPRLSLVYSVDTEKNHNIRASFQTGFRNPTTQDLYIGLDAGRAILVGSAKDNLDRYTSHPLDVSTTGQMLGFPSNVQISGRSAYDNSFSLSSVLSGAPQKSDFNYVQPEKVRAYEIGYRAFVSGLSIDINGYYNDYDQFIGNKTVLVPYYGQTDLSDIHPVAQAPNALIAMNYGDYKPFQVYTNSDAEISSYGIGISLATKVFNGFDLGVNYTLSEFNFDQETDPDYLAMFNTPKNKIKASFGKPNLIRNLGFNVNFRWHDEYKWESSFVVGDIPANSVIDAQVNYSIPKLNSTIKAGGTNIGGNDYFSAPGSGYIGSMYYLSLTVNL